MSNAQSIVNQIKYNLLRNPGNAHLFISAASGTVKGELPLPTPYMVQAGNAIIEALQVHRFNLRLYGLGEAKTIEEWVSEELPNQDLIVAFLQGKIDTPTAMYLAMRRAEIALK